MPLVTWWQQWNTWSRYDRRGYPLPALLQSPWPAHAGPQWPAFSLLNKILSNRVLLTNEPKEPMKGRQVFNISKSVLIVNLTKNTNQAPFSSQVGCGIKNTNQPTHSSDDHARWNLTTCLSLDTRYTDNSYILSNKVYQGLKVSARSQLWQLNTAVITCTV